MTRVVADHMLHGVIDHTLRVVVDFMLHFFWSHATCCRAWDVDCMQRGVVDHLLRGLVTN
jgi:hypothetical protein